MTNRPGRRPVRAWIRQGYLDGLEDAPYENAPGPERHPVEGDGAALPERWRSYLAGLHLGLNERGWRDDEAA
jgi:hypothetical protein